MANIQIFDDYYTWYLQITILPLKKRNSLIGWT